MQSKPLKGNVSMRIIYARCDGRADAANIVGGIADVLQHIAYDDDRQIRSLQYSERVGPRDEYWVSVKRVR